MHKALLTIAATALLAMVAIAGAQETKSWTLNDVEKVQ